MSAIRFFPAALLGLGLLVLAGVAAYEKRRRRDPSERERKRRLQVNATGRLGDATVVDVSDGAIYYEYMLSGVAYATSQDISKLTEHLPAEVDRLIGRAVSVKYSSNNPANSILVCEEWSGLYRQRPEEPKPPSPRTLSPNSPSSHSAGV